MSGIIYFIVNKDEQMYVKYKNIFCSPYKKYATKRKDGSIMSKEPHKIKSSLSLLRDTVAAFLCGLIFSCAQLGSIASPIPVAAAFCTGSLGSAAVLLGTLATCCISGEFAAQLPLILSLMLAACIRIFLREYNSLSFVSVSSSLCVFAAGMICSFAQNEGAEGILVSIMSAILTGTTAYFLNTVIISLGNHNKIRIKSSVGCAAAVVYFVLIAALCSFEFSLINPGYVIGVAVTLMAAQRSRYSGGVICGALTACGAMLSAQELGMSLAFLPVTGLLAGYMAESGGIVTSGVFFLFNALAQLTVQSRFTTYSSIGNLMLGCIVYLLLHTICLDKWLVSEEPAAQKILDNMAVRMNFMAESISNVRADTERISELLSHSSEEAPSHNKTPVCAVCVTHDACVEKSSSTAQTCTDNCKVIEHEQKRVKLRKEKAARKTESRNILFQQLLASEKMLSSFGESMAIRYSSELTEAIERRLERCGYYCDCIAAYYNDKERLMIELYSEDRQFEEEISSICKVISRMLRVEFQESQKVRTKKSVRFCLCQETPFYIKTHSAKRCAENGNVSGDTSVIFHDGTGFAYAVLSDGMGTGKAAAVESRMTAEMFRKLKSSGIDTESAVRIINGLMLTKSEQESFATLDAACFDLDSCELRLMKAGAASSIIKQGDRILRVCAPTFPIGIAASPDIFTESIKLSAGDLVVMMSDGVPESQYSFIKELLLNSDDMDYVAEEICRKAQIFSGGRCRDDVSVMIIELCSRNDSYHL